MTITYHRHYHRERRFHRPRQALGFGWYDQDAPLALVKPTDQTSPQAEEQQPEHPLLRTLAVRGMCYCGAALAGLLLGAYWKIIFGACLLIRDWIRS